MTTAILAGAHMRDGWSLDDLGNNKKARLGAQI